MHNIKNIRKNPKNFLEQIKLRNINLNIDNLLLLDKQNRELIQKKELFEQEKKKISKTKDETLFIKSKKLTSEITLLEKKQIQTQNKIKSILSSLPNLPLSDVPIGKNATFNKEIYIKGNIPKFDFNPRSHHEVGQILNMIDSDLAAKTSGSRFTFLKNQVAHLERAISSFMLDTHTKKNGYIEISPPLIVLGSTMYGTGQLPKFENDQFELKLDEQNEKKYLIPTAEVILTNTVREKILSIKDFPIRLVASTACFRKEAGNYGKDTKGIIRQHQFYKVELVSIVDPKECETELERMTNCAENILKDLKLPYRKVLLSSGDMGFSAEKTYDLEVWLPSENKYREISSCSSCGTFQARRMNAKFKSIDNEIVYVGTLNGSGLAVGRTLIAILENYQQKDGSVIVPEILRPYMDGLDCIK